MQIQILPDRKPRKITELPLGTIIKDNAGGIWLISMYESNGIPEKRKIVTSLLDFSSGSFEYIGCENEVEGEHFTVIVKMEFKE